MANIVGPALEIAPPDSLELARLLAVYGRVRGVEEGNYPAADAAFQKGFAIAKNIGDLDLEQRTLAEAAQVDMYHLRHEDAVSKARQALAVPVHTPNLPLECASWYVVCFSTLASGKPVVTSDVTTFLAKAERLGNRFWLHAAYWIQEWVHRLQGNWCKAREYSDRGLEMVPSALTIMSTRPHLEFETNETVRGTEFLRFWVTLPGEPNPDPTFRYAATSLVLGSAAWISGEATHNDLARQAAEVVISSDFAVPGCLCAALGGISLIAVMEGDAAECRRLYGDLTAYQGTHTPFMAVDRILGLLAGAMGELDAAATHLEQGLSDCENMKNSPERAWTAHAYANALLERNSPGDRVQGTAYLDEAEALAQELNMAPVLRRVEESRLRLDFRPPTNPGGLTTREVEVLRLVSAGKTDREIAEELIISARTVTTHVSHILNKTGAANRAEAASYATRNGLT